MPNKRRIYNLERVKHQAVKDLLTEVDEECEDRSVDGVIVILGRNGGKVTRYYTAGSLSKPDVAALEAFRLEFAMAHEKSKASKE